MILKPLHKIGDKVKIRSDLIYGKYYCCVFFNGLKSDKFVCFVDAMNKYLNKTVTIKSVRQKTDNGYFYYNIEEDDCMWNWVDEMFENFTNCYFESLI